MKSQAPCLARVCRFQSAIIVYEDPQISAYSRWRSIILWIIPLPVLIQLRTSSTKWNYGLLRRWIFQHFGNKSSRNFPPEKTGCLTFMQCICFSQIDGGVHIPASIKSPAILVGKFIWRASIPLMTAIGPPELYFGWILDKLYFFPDNLCCV